jgi:P-type Ca2+ transporter type 2C
LNAPAAGSRKVPARPSWQGLTEAQAAARLAADGPNLLPGSAPKSLAAIMLEVATEPMFLMLLAAGAIYLLLGDRGEAMFLLAFVFAVMGITLAQERRTQRALDSLRDLSAPRALVIRQGAERRIAGREVVCEDVLVLHEGDRVPADAVLLDGQLSVDESLLTGESVPVDKLPGPGGAEVAIAAPGGDGTPLLFASTVVTRGVGVAQVHAPPPPPPWGASARRWPPPASPHRTFNSHRAGWCSAWASARWGWPPRRCCWPGCGTGGRFWRACCRALRWRWRFFRRKFR